MRRRVALLFVILLSVSTPVTVLAQEDSSAATVEIISPVSGWEVGGIVSIIGTVSGNTVEQYSIAFGEGEEPSRWIPIVSDEAGDVLDERLAFWDTTKIPDGVYALRLRALSTDANVQYIDSYVRDLSVSNAPRTPTRGPTYPPTSTPTPTPSPTPTFTPRPTLSLEDGVSPFLYVNQMDQHDPLCLEWRQLYSVWVSNIGMITVTNIVLTDTFPRNTDPILANSTEDGLYDGDHSIRWEIGDLPPGGAKKVELQIDVPDWMESGTWITNDIVVSCDQVPKIATSERSLLSNCPWLRETTEARALLLPTEEPSPTPTSTRTRVPPSALKPTLLPTNTPLSFSVPAEGMQASLDVLTVLIIVALGLVIVAIGILGYRRLRRR